MLSGSKRLSGEQLNLVIKEGRVSHSPLFWLRILKYSGPTKAVVIVPNKIVKTASGRVALRRKGYDAIQDFIELLPAGNLVVICAKLPMQKAPKEDISNEMKDIFVKCGLLK